MARDASKLRIGQVCAALTAEFPDISISKLRFLEEQGLVEPERTPGGYRLYSETDLVKLRHILRMQRDEFLPLRVIRDELRRRITQGPTEVASNGNGGSSRTIDREDFAARAGVSSSFVESCEQHDVVQPVLGGDRFAADDVAVIKQAAVLAGQGVPMPALASLRLSCRKQASIARTTIDPSTLAAHDNLPDGLASFVRQCLLRDLQPAETHHRV